MWLGLVATLTALAALTVVPRGTLAPRASVSSHNRVTGTGMAAAPTQIPTAEFLTPGQPAVRGTRLAYHWPTLQGTFRNLTPGTVVRWPLVNIPYMDVAVIRVRLSTNKLPAMVQLRLFTTGTNRYGIPRSDPDVVTCTRMGTIGADPHCVYAISSQEVTITCHRRSEEALSNLVAYVVWVRRLNKVSRGLPTADLTESSSWGWALHD